MQTIQQDFVLHDFKSDDELQNEISLHTLDVEWQIVGNNASAQTIKYALSLHS